MRPSPHEGVREAAVAYVRRPVRHEPAAVFGVDFSGARRAGDATWIARLDPLGGGRHALRSLDRLTDVAPSPHRQTALRALVDRVAASPRLSLWALDAPLGLPLEVLDARWRWASVAAHAASWRRGAYGWGLRWVGRSKRRTGALHTYRLTDREAKAPFDPFHYRIIYQTFHALRDVALPLRAAGEVAVMPFDRALLAARGRALVETCPSSTLQRLGLPHQCYKKANGALTAMERRTRARIVEGLAPFVELPRPMLRVALADPGGDALDAVIAALGASQAWAAADLDAIAAHPRYRREGFLFV
jgi:hypothetical protein